MAGLRDRADVPGSKLASERRSDRWIGVEFVGCFDLRGFDRAADDGVDQPSMVPVFEIDLVVRGGDWSSAATRPVYGCGLSRGR
ncbi:hypothetical protein SEA_SUMTER_90 [Mycobacterium phage Sumter]|nr:hypothetical protein SEA_SUMTER_90 [Mycobacterium phage Sumter]